MNLRTCSICGVEKSETSDFFTSEKTLTLLGKNAKSVLKT